ncbi:hypothetical protein DOZ80_11610 [Pseudomonas fluorescens]|uniref:Uncharacterized protein n=1 Tax=Pseudomonas fluorescens TaxID=294 RepID=A0A327NAC8_PSEFL|nr:hypothetical protein DOZ80_11610 [Pseudomonas fluorescens]
MVVHDNAGKLMPRSVLRFFVGTPPGASSLLQSIRQCFDVSATQKTPHSPTKKCPVSIDTRHFCFGSRPACGGP